MDGLCKAHSFRMACDVCRHMGLGIPAFRVALSQGAKSLYTPRMDLQCNLRAGFPSNCGAVSRDCITDGGRATLTDEIFLSRQKRTCADSYPLTQACRPLRCNRFTHPDCRVCLDTCSSL